jgi:hypothetical protein
MIRTRLVSALFRQFDSFFGAIDTIHVHCRKIYNSFPLTAKQIRKSRQNSYIWILYFRQCIYCTCILSGFFFSLVSLLRKYFVYILHFFWGGIEMIDWMNLLCWYIFIINAMRSCNERTTLHCVESYLYYIILVNKQIFSEEWHEGEKKIDNIHVQYIHCRKYKIHIYEFWRDFLITV